MSMCVQVAREGSQCARTFRKPGEQRGGVFQVLQLPNRGQCYRQHPLAITYPC